MAFHECLFRAHCEEFAGSSCLVALGVVTGGSYAFGPGSVDACVFFVAVVVSAVVDFDDGEVGSLAVFLKSGHSDLGLEVDEVLEMDGSFAGCFLNLPGAEGGSGLGTPGLDEVFT